MLSRVFALQMPRPRHVALAGAVIFSMMLVGSALARSGTQRNAPAADATAEEPDLTQDWANEAVKPAPVRSAVKVDKPSIEKPSVEKTAAVSAPSAVEPTAAEDPHKIETPEAIVVGRASSDRLAEDQATAELKGMIAQLRSQVADLEQSLSTSKETIASLQNSAPTPKELDLLRQTLSAKNSEILQLKTQLQTVLTDRPKPREIIVSPDSDVLQDKIRLYQAREQVLVEKLTKARSDLAQSQSELNGLRNEAKHSGFVQKERETLRSDLSESQKTIADLESALEQKKNIEQNNGFLRSEIERYRKENVDYSSKNTALSDQVKRATEELSALKAKTASQEKDLSAKTADLEQTKTALAKSSADAAMCSANLSTAQGKLVKFEEMEKALIRTRNDLVLKETEIRTLQPSAPANTASAANARTAAPAPAARAAAPRPTPLQSSDVLIGEVTEDKVNLRSGPGLENSPVMQVQRGARLTIEAREGDWYRVITPTDTRAYIKADVLRPMNDISSAPVRTIGLPRGNAPEPIAIPAPPPTPSAAVSAGEDEAKAAFEALKAQLKAAPR